MVVTRAGQKKKQASLDYLTIPLKKKRGRKPRSLLPPPLNPGPLSFFKVLIGDFRDVLFIPPMATCILKGLAKKYVCFEDVTGNHWSVKMSMIDGSLAFQHGWHDFVSDHSITVGEFILFTYTGGLLFTARIFGTCALERVDFKMERQKCRCAKERCAELKPVSVMIPKCKTYSLASEEQDSPCSTEVIRSLKRKKTVECDFPKVYLIESDSISEGYLKISSEDEKPLYKSNSKDTYNALHDSEQILHRNSNAMVGELIKISLAELENSDTENIEAVASKSSRNRMSTSEKGAALLHSGGAMLSKQTVEKPDTLTKPTIWVVKEHFEIKEGPAEMSGLQAQMNKERDEMKNKVKIEQDHSNDLEMLDSKPRDEKMASQSNLEHAECSPKMEFNLTKYEGIAEKSFLLADAIRHTTLDEKLIEHATGASFNANGQEEPTCPNDHVTFSLETSVTCETISVVSSNPMLDHTNDKKENLVSISEEYGAPQTKGIAHDAIFSEDEKNVTPCSRRRCQVKTDRSDSVEIPSSGCVCLSDDIQSFLAPEDGINANGQESAELPKNALSTEEMQDQMDQFTCVMHQKFLAGEDTEHLDYYAIDNDEGLDDHWVKEANHDAEEKRFDED